MHFFGYIRYAIPKIEVSIQALNGFSVHINVLLGVKNGVQIGKKRQKYLISLVLPTMTNKSDYI